MSSKTSFGLVMVLLGLFGMWLLITGKLAAWQQILAKETAQQKASAGTSTSSSTSSNGNASSSAPQAPTNIKPAPLQSGDHLSMLTTSPFGMTTSPQAYGIVVGDAGARIEPIAA